VNEVPKVAKLHSKQDLVDTNDEEIEAPGVSGTEEDAKPKAKAQPKEPSDEDDTSSEESAAMDISDLSKKQLLPLPKQKFHSVCHTYFESGGPTKTHNSQLQGIAHIMAHQLVHGAKAIPPPKNPKANPFLGELKKCVMSFKESVVEDVRQDKFTKDYEHMKFELWHHATKNKHKQSALPGLHVKALTQLGVLNPKKNETKGEN